MLRLSEGMVPVIVRKLKEFIHFHIQQLEHSLFSCCSRFTEGSRSSQPDGARFMRRPVQAKSNQWTMEGHIISHNADSHYTSSPSKVAQIQRRPSQNVPNSREFVQPAKYFSPQFSSSTFRSRSALKGFPVISLAGHPFRCTAVRSLRQSGKSHWWILLYDYSIGEIPLKRATSLGIYQIWSIRSVTTFSLESPIYLILDAHSADTNFKSFALELSFSLNAAITAS